MRSRLCWFLLLMFAAEVAYAQIACRAGSIVFSPGAPIGGDTVVIAVETPLRTTGRIVDAVVSSSTINVTVTGVSAQLVTPPVCFNVTVGPLGAGTYTVNYFFADEGFSPARVTQVMSATLIVVDGGVVPTVSQSILIVIALGILAVGYMGMRRGGLT
jgi:hypothetical protein